MTPGEMTIVAAAIPVAAVMVVSVLRLTYKVGALISTVNASIGEATRDRNALQSAINDLTARFDRHMTAGHGMRAR